MRSAVRILPLTTTKGLHVLSIAAGFLHGIIGTWTINWCKDHINFSPGMVSRFGVLTLLLLLLLFFSFPAWVFGRLVARVHPKFLTTLWVALAYAPFCILGVVLVVFRLNPESMLIPWTMSVAGQMSVGIAAAMVIYGTIFAVFLVCVVFSGHLTERFLGRPVIIQSGMDCWSCGYNLGSDTLSTCPECGSAFDPARFPGNRSLSLLGTLTRVRYPALLLAALLSLTPLAFTINSHTIPCAGFLSARPPATELRKVWITNFYTFRSGSGKGTFQVPLETGWWLPDAPGSEIGIAVQFAPDAIGPEPRMYITRAQLSDPGAFSGLVTPRETWWLQCGSHCIVAKLDAAQARLVIQKRSVPDALLDAIRAKAQTAGWSTTSTITSPSGTEIVVDPDLSLPVAPEQPPTP